MPTNESYQEREEYTHRKQSWKGMSVKMFRTPPQTSASDGLWSMRGWEKTWGKKVPFTQHPFISKTHTLTHAYTQKNPSETETVFKCK